MGKDPAVLFYTSDFISGTELFSYEQKGQYIHLLCIQHQSGHLPESYMLKILESFDNPVFAKFKKDTDGNYFQQRMEDESEKRKNYSKSRKENIRRRYEPTYEPTYVDTYVEHMKIHMENGNVNKDLNAFNKVDSERQQEIFTYFHSKGYPDSEAEEFYNHYESQGWVTGSGIPITNWRLKAENWHKEQRVRNMKLKLNSKTKLTHAELLETCKGMTADETKVQFSKYKFNDKEKVFELA